MSLAGRSASYSDGVAEGGINKVPCWWNILHSNHHTIAYIRSVETHEMTPPPSLPLPSAVITMHSKSLIINIFPLRSVFIAMLSQTNALFIIQKVTLFLSSFYP